MLKPRHRLPGTITMIDIGRTAIDPHTVPPIEDGTAAARWVDRYLMPIVSGRLANGAMRCLQVEPENPHEAMRLRAIGHTCDLVNAACQLPAPSGHYDLVMCGAFGRVTAEYIGRQALVREFARVTRRGGAVLLTLGNRRCPVDLSSNTTLLHGFNDEALATPGEIRRLFVRDGGFTAVTLLSLANYFSGSQSGSAVRRMAAACTNVYLRCCHSMPTMLLREAPFTPMFAYWIER